MAKKIVIGMLVLCLMFVFAGCASKKYVVQTKDGKEYLSDSEPEFNKKTQSYEFKDLKGSKWMINREEIKSISVTDKD
jgi:hypothetical protein